LLIDSCAAVVPETRGRRDNRRDRRGTSLVPGHSHVSAFPEEDKDHR